MHRLKRFLIYTDDGRLAITTWPFWRQLIIVFCLFCWIGHAAEVPYCLFMDHFFGIVADDYAIWFEPWYTPYWVYGIGVVAITLIFKPFKRTIYEHTKTWFGRFIETFIYITILAAVLETLIGLIINQPNHLGKYPFWDNSQLPLNIAQQGWLINDIMLGVVGSLYYWVVYPLIEKALNKMPAWAANMVFVVIVVLFGLATYFAYLHI